MIDEVQTEVRGGTPPPASFGYPRRDAYQKRINELTGTHNGRPLMKLAWAPDELRWMPHKLGDEPHGYTYPIFCTGKDEQGRFIAPERWVLLERVEPEQYAWSWEAKRYVNLRGVIYDVKGPCPSEKYVELRCHSYHDTTCCPCSGDTCKCGDSQHCWGKYMQPDEHLMAWIQETAWEAQRDADVNPTADERVFTAPNAQRELVSQLNASADVERSIIADLDSEVTDYWIKQPHSVGTERRTENGIILLN